MHSFVLVGLFQGSGSRAEEAAVSRYSSQYEQRLDPFSAFNQRVSDCLDSLLQYVKFTGQWLHSPLVGSHVPSPVLFFHNGWLILSSLFLCVQEKQQRYLGLSPHEKVTLNLVSAQFTQDLSGVLQEYAILSCGVGIAD